MPRPPYNSVDADGWTIKMESTLPTPLAGQLKSHVRAQLAEMALRLPPAAVDRLKQSVSIYIDESTPTCPGVAAHYHEVGTDWLRRNDEPAEKAGAVNIADARIFISRTSGPSANFSAMLLHEFAHAYHNRFATGGYNNGTIKRAYDTAMGKNLYSDAKSNAWGGRDEREYFAGLSTAYFWLNDWFPHTRQELQQYDEAGFEMVRSIWGVQ